MRQAVSSYKTNPMTLIHGQVESLKKVKSTLKQKGVNRFKSIRDINQFLEGFDNELRDVNSKVEAGFRKELEELKQQKTVFEDYYNSAKEEKENKLKEKIKKLQLKVAKKGVAKLWRWLLKIQLNRFERNFDKKIERQLSQKKKNLEELRFKVNELEYGERTIIRQRAFSERNKLKRIKAIVDEMSTIIAGAIGESQVSKELQKLSDEYILINDFSKAFIRPIYNKREHDRIFSIQIDHLLIGRSGVFILETKNWSKSSIASLSLRSPIEQIKRASYALFVLLNGNKNTIRKVGLKWHHWGDRQIPIRNVIVMVNHKPKESFKYVQVKHLKELVRYIEYFEPVMSIEETNKVYEYLKNE